MAISTLTKFTVPLASNQSSATQSLLMPKLQYRFRVTLQNFGISTPTTELTKQVMDITRPNVSFEPITIDVYNSRVYLAGKHKWETMSLTLREDVNGNVQKLVGEQLQKQFDFLEQSSAASAIDYKFSLRIEMLDGGNGAVAPNVLETWECYGCYLTAVNYQNLAYGEQTPAMIDLTIQPDNCVQTPAGTGLGTVVGRTVGVLATGAGV